MSALNEIHNNYYTNQKSTENTENLRRDQPNFTAQEFKAHADASTDLHTQNSYTVTFWNKLWQNNLGTELYKLHRGGLFCDTLITAGDGTTIRAHSAVLVSSSPILKKHFQLQIINMEIHKTYLHYENPNISNKIWRVLLEFMYTGKVSFSVLDMSVLIQVAEELLLNVFLEAENERSTRIYDAAIFLRKFQPVAGNVAPLDNAYYSSAGSYNYSTDNTQHRYDNKYDQAKKSTQNISETNDAHEQEMQSRSYSVLKAKDITNAFPNVDIYVSENYKDQDSNIDSVDQDPGYTLDMSSKVAKVYSEGNEVPTEHNSQHDYPNNAHYRHLDADDSNYKHRKIEEARVDKEDAHPGLLHTHWQNPEPAHQQQYVCENIYHQPVEDPNDETVHGRSDVQYLNQTSFIVGTEVPLGDRRHRASHFVNENESSYSYDENIQNSNEGKFQEPHGKFQDPGKFQNVNINDSDLSVPKSFSNKLDADREFYQSKYFGDGNNSFPSWKTHVERLHERVDVVKHVSSAIEDDRYYENEGDDSAFVDKYPNRPPETDFQTLNNGVPQKSSYSIQGNAQPYDMNTDVGIRYTETHIDERNSQNSYREPIYNRMYAELGQADDTYSKYYPAVESSPDPVALVKHFTTSTANIPSPYGKQAQTDKVIGDQNLERVRDYEDKRYKSKANSNAYEPESMSTDTQTTYTSVYKDLSNYRNTSPRDTYVTAVSEFSYNTAPVESSQFETLPVSAHNSFVYGTQRHDSNQQDYPSESDRISGTSRKKYVDISSVESQNSGNYKDSAKISLVTETNISKRNIPLSGHKSLSQKIERKSIEENAKLDSRKQKKGDSGSRQDSNERPYDEQLLTHKQGNPRIRTEESSTIRHNSNSKVKAKSTSSGLTRNDTSVRGEFENHPSTNGPKSENKHLILLSVIQNFDRPNITPTERLKGKLEQLNIHSITKINSNENKLEMASQKGTTPHNETASYNDTASHNEAATKVADIEQSKRRNTHDVRGSSSRSSEGQPTSIVADETKCRAQRKRNADTNIVTNPKKQKMENTLEKLNSTGLKSESHEEEESSDVKQTTAQAQPVTIADGCTLCSTNLRQGESLLAHVMREHVDVVTKLDEKEDILQHSVKVEPFDTAQIECMRCGENFANLAILHNHLKKTHKVNGYQCQQCQYIADTVSGLAIHSTLKHKPAGKQCSRRLLCSVCDKTFTNYVEAREHRKYAHGQKPFECTLCNDVFSSKALIWKHFVCVHVSGVFKCSICDSTFLSKMMLTNHLLVHKKKRDLIVAGSKCDKVLQNQDDRSSHVKSDSEHSKLDSTKPNRDKPTKRRKKSPPCPHCSKIFSSQTQLENHIFRVHKREKNPNRKHFKCKECGIEIAGARTFRDHLQTHSGIKPHLCEDCGQSFARKSSLKRHTLSHSGTKDFQCCHCQRKFSREDILLQHERLHTGEKPYTCDKCGIGFRQKNSLNVHMNNHHKQ